MTARPADWSPLAGTDPTPGNPDETARLAKRAADTAEEINQQAANLRKLAGADWWDADAGREFSEEATDLAGEMVKAHGRYATVGSQLNGYAGALDHAQAETAAALREAKQAESAMQANAGDPLKGIDKPTDAQRSAARRKQDAHTDAAGALQAARRRMDGAVDDLDAVAKRAADAIKDASDDAVKDGFWDKVKGFVSDHAAFIKAVCDIIGKITLVLSVVVLALALTVGAPFVLLVGLAVLTAVALVGHTALAASGDGSWVDVGLDVFALATFGIGGGLARAGEQAGAEAVAQAGRVASTEAAERVLSQNRTMLAVSRWATETRIPLGPLRSLGTWQAARIVAESARAGDVAEALVTTRPLTAVPFRQALPTLDREIAQRLDLVRAVTREFPSADGIEAARRFAMFSYTQAGVTAVGLGVDVTDRSGALDGAKGSHAK
jgi:hypothetical protein